MTLVRTVEQRAEVIAHLLDNSIRVPGLGFRLGVDPLVGLIPLVGDVIAVVAGTTILLMARQLSVPWPTIALMGLNQAKNGVIGAIPFIGDAYSFHFRSHVANVALLLRTVKKGQDEACLLTPKALRLQDFVGVAALMVPIIALVFVLSQWFWNHNVSIPSLLFLPPYHR